MVYCLWNRQRILLPLYPWAMSRLKKTFVWLTLSSFDEQRVKIRKSVLYTIPGSSPGGWAECGGMYKCKFIFFLNIVVSILFELFVVIVMSMKSTILDHSLNSHVSAGNAFIVLMKEFHSVSSIWEFWFGHQMPMTLSINLL